MVCFLVSESQGILPPRPPYDTARTHPAEGPSTSTYSEQASARRWSCPLPETLAGMLHDADTNQLVLGVWLSFDPLDDVSRGTPPVLIQVGNRQTAAFGLVQLPIKHGLKHFHRVVAATEFVWVPRALVVAGRGHPVPGVVRFFAKAPALSQPGRQFNVGYEGRGAIVRFQQCSS